MTKNRSKYFPEKPTSSRSEDMRIDNSSAWGILCGSYIVSGRCTDASCLRKSLPRQYHIDGKGARHHMLQDPGEQGLAQVSEKDLTLHGPVEQAHPRQQHHNPPLAKSTRDCQSSTAQVEGNESKHWSYERQSSRLTTANITSTHRITTSTKDCQGSTART